MTTPTPPNRRFFIGNQQPNSYHASLRRSSVLSTPPSAFNFSSSPQPAANPDPLPSRRKSFDSWVAVDRDTDTAMEAEHGYFTSAEDRDVTLRPRPRSGSVGDLSLSPPNPPFAGGNGKNSYRDSNGSEISSSSWNGSDSSNSGSGVYRNSAAGQLVSSQSSPDVDLVGYPTSVYGHGYGQGGYGSLQGSPTASQVNFRPAFLSPASRPSSTVQAWVPPTYLASSASSVDGFQMNGSGAGMGEKATSTGVGLRASSRNASRTNIRPSTLLVKESVPSLKAKAAASSSSPSQPPPPGSENEKHIPGEKTVSPLYNAQPLPRTRTARYLTLLCILIGLAGAALLCFTGVQEAKRSLLDEGSLCLVMNEDWSSGSDLDSSRWGKEVELGGFGNGEFQMTTDSNKNIYIKDGQLYIMPTLTSEDVPDWDQDGKEYVLDGCTGSGGVPAPSTNSTSSNGGNSTTNGGGNSTTTNNGGNTNGGGKNGGTNNNGGGTTTTTGTNNGGDNTGDGTNNRRWLLPRQRATTTRSTASASQSSSASSPSSSASSNSTSSSAGGVTSNPNTSGPGRDTNACVAKTDESLGTVVNPVRSGRVSTRGKVGIRYGRVEVRAKVGRG